MADSSIGGYLPPTGMPAEDSDLDAIFQPAVAAITGLAGSLVRPRWQPGNPVQPEPSVNWCAIGVTVITPDAGPWIGQGATSSEQGAMQRHEDIELACTFYGPQAGGYSARLRDGLGIPQNNEALRAQGIAFIEFSEMRSVPELFNQQWIKGQNLTIRFRRKIKRSYGILTILSADPALISDEIGII